MFFNFFIIFFRTRFFINFKKIEKTFFFIFCRFFLKIENNIFSIFSRFFSDASAKSDPNPKEWPKYPHRPVLIRFRYGFNTVFLGRLKPGSDANHFFFNFFSIFSRFFNHPTAAFFYNFFSGPESRCVGSIFFSIFTKNWKKNATAQTGKKW